MSRNWDREKRRTDKLLAEIGQEQPYCGFGVGNGWFPIVADALRKMSKVGVSWQLAQVKQKFCQLRIYVDFHEEKAAHEGGTPPWIWEEGHPLHSKYQEIHRIIGEAEGLCDVACEGCGKKVAGGPASGSKLCKRCRSWSNFRSRLSMFRWSVRSWFRKIWK